MEATSGLDESSVSGVEGLGESLFRVSTRENGKGRNIGIIWAIL